MSDTMLHHPIFDELNAQFEEEFGYKIFTVRVDENLKDAIPEAPNVLPMYFEFSPTYTGEWLLYHNEQGNEMMVSLHEPDQPEIEFEDPETYVPERRSISDALKITTARGKENKALETVIDVMLEPPKPHVAETEIQYFKTEPLEKGISRRLRRKHNKLQQEITDSVLLGGAVNLTKQRRAALLKLAQADGQPWTKDQIKSGWSDHMAEMMYGADLDAGKKPEDMIDPMEILKSIGEDADAMGEVAKGMEKAVETLKKNNPKTGPDFFSDQVKDA